MTREEFGAGFVLLEGAFGEQNPEKREFYRRQFEHSQAWAFMRAARRIVETRDDGYGFPLVAEIGKAIEEIQRDRSSANGADLETRGYCQRCDNRGFYLNEEETASLCSCRAGRFKEARFKIGLGARRSEIEEEVKKLAPAESPVRGLREKNEAGFWEDTQEEHEAWKTRKLAQIEELKARRTAMPGNETGPSDELRFKEIRDTAARVKFQDKFLPPPEREPGDDVEDEVGF